MSRWIFLSCVVAALDVQGWRAASNRASRIPFEFSAIPLCEMVQGDVTNRELGLLETWWLGARPTRIADLDLSAEKGVTELCRSRLKKSDIRLLSDLAENEVWYSYMIGGQEVKVSLGKMNDTESGPKPHIYSHKTFHVYRLDKKIHHVRAIASALVPLRDERELRSTYDVVTHNANPLTHDSINKIHFYNSFCVAIITGIVFIVLKRDLSNKSLRTFDFTVHHSYLTPFALTYAIGSQIVCTIVLTVLISILTNAVFDYKYTPALWRATFTFGQIINGLTLFRIFRVHKGQDVTSTIVAGLLTPCGTFFLIMWQLNGLFTALQSSRAVSTHVLLLKTISFLVIFLVPLHYMGALLAIYMSHNRQSKVFPLLPSLENHAPMSLSTFLPLVLSTFPFGVALPLISLMAECIFGYQEFTIAPFVTLCELAAIICTILLCSVVAIYVNFVNGNNNWIKSPMLIGVGMCCWLVLHTVWQKERFKTTWAASVDYYTVMLTVAACAGLATAAVGFQGVELYCKTLNSD